MFGSEVIFLHCAATVTLLSGDKSDLCIIGYPEQERVAFMHSLKLLLHRSFFYYLIYLFMNTKKKYVFIGFLTLLIVTSSIVFFVLNNKNTAGKLLDKNSLNIQNERNPSPQVEKVTDTAKKVLKIETPVASGENNINVTISVFNKAYNLSTKEGTTLYQEMLNLQDLKENNFSFKGKEYPSLGFFVEEINGVKESPGKYWLYYTNGKEAPVGVSKYFLKNGDIINWKQE